MSCRDPAGRAITPARKRYTMSHPPSACAAAVTGQMHLGRTTAVAPRTRDDKTPSSPSMSRPPWCCLAGQVSRIFVFTRKKTDKSERKPAARVHPDINRKNVLWAFSLRSYLGFQVSQPLMSVSVPHQVQDRDQIILRSGPVHRNRQALCRHPLTGPGGAEETLGPTGIPFLPPKHAQVARSRGEQPLHDASGSTAAVQ